MPPARAAAALLASLWLVFSWPELRAHTFERAALLAALAAIVAGLVARFVPGLGRALHAALTRPSERAFVAGACVVAAAITAWVHHVPMHDQVVSGDACMYVAQSRPLSHFELALPAPAPRIAHSAKFLVEGVDGRLHGVFVPGYPLFLALFARWDAFLLAALVTSTLFTVAHAALARAALRDVFAARLSVLLVLASFARAIQTADLLSHAFTGALAALAVTAALRLRERPSLGAAAGLGVAAGWVFASRMLDGFVLGAVLAAALAAPLWRRRLPVRAAALALACALPFVALVAAQQHAATGSFRRATVLEYADRSDWPPRCLHLGFGWEVGCMVEHAAERASFGPDGYTPDDGLRLIRERTGLHGAEVFGAAAVPAVAMAAVALGPTIELLLLALFPVALTLAYGLFYYGNGEVHGARHVFPAAPFTASVVAWAIARAARARGGGDVERRLGAALLAAAAFALAAHAPRWRAGVARTDHYQNLRGLRIDLRKLLAEQNVTRGIVIFPDVHSYLVALDPWRDGDRMVIVYDDGAGELDLRRFHPDLPVYLVLRDRRLLPVRNPAPPPGLQLELERAWPTFQRPAGLSSRIVHTVACCGIPASGGLALAVFESRPGATLDVPFDLAAAGTYTFRLDGVSAPENGRYEILVDGEPLLTWDGYAPARAALRGTPSAPRALARGPHTFTARCVGKAPEAIGHLAVFDAFVAEPAAP
ncbi:MAG: hypothetical protein U0324_08825 [Polyangiales bacterium]